MALLLEGANVLDLTNVMAGPYCARTGARSAGDLMSLHAAPRLGWRCPHHGAGRRGDQAAFLSATRAAWFAKCSIAA